MICKSFNIKRAIKSLQNFIILVLNLNMLLIFKLLLLSLMIFSDAHAAFEIFFDIDIDLRYPRERVDF